MSRHRTKVHRSQGRRRADGSGRRPRRRRRGRRKQTPGRSQRPGREEPRSGRSRSASQPTPGNFCLRSSGRVRRSSRKSRCGRSGSCWAGPSAGDSMFLFGICPCFFWFSPWHTIDISWPMGTDLCFLKSETEKSDTPVNSALSSFRFQISFQTARRKKIAGNQIPKHAEHISRLQFRILLGTDFRFQIPEFSRGPRAGSSRFQISDFRFQKPVYAQPQISDFRFQKTKEPG